MTYIFLITTIIFFICLLNSAETNADLKKQMLNIQKDSKKEMESYKNYINQQFSIEQQKINKERLDLQKEKNILEHQNQPLIQASEALAEAFSQEATRLFDTVKFQLLNKVRPAYSAADKVAILKKETKRQLKDLKKYQYIINAYEQMFPWLNDFKETTMKEAFISENKLDEDEEIFRHYLSENERNNLSKSEKFQKALDRYTNSWDKTNWQIGLFFERYIGYLYEQGGYKVIMNGAKERWQDMGIDLIASKGKETQLIQCKYWAQDKTIFEKYIFQLFGTSINYIIENYDKNKNPLDLIFSKKVIPVFITSTKLSDTAKRISNTLGIQIKENFHLEKDYPKIKCNPSSKDGMIYHLPFDQQYDNFQVSQTPGAFYAFTIQEAEDRGFRRAYKWNYKNK